MLDGKEIKSSASRPCWDVVSLFLPDSESLLSIDSALPGISICFIFGLLAPDE
jgi:hypothetical protein